MERNASTLSGWEKIFEFNYQDIVHCSSFNVHLSFWSGAAPAMTNELSTMNNEQ
jgi:hypothetical protein